MKAATAPDISFVLVNYRADAATRQAIAAIRADTADEAVEIIVVDNGCTVSGLAGHPGCTVLPSARNLGFAGAVNRALPLCRGRYVALVNNDAVLLPGWTRTLRRILDGDAGIGIVGGFEIDWEGPERARGAPTLCPDTATTRTAPRSEAARRVPFVSASNCMVRRAAMPAWDAAYFLYYEDVDACAQIRAAGYAVIDTPEAGIRHRRNHATDRLGWRKDFYVHRGRYRFILKWFAPPARRRSLAAAVREDVAWSAGEIARSAVLAATGRYRRRFLPGLRLAIGRLAAVAVLPVLLLTVPRMEGRRAPARLPEPADLGSADPGR